MVHLCDHHKELFWHLLPSQLRLQFPKRHHLKPHQRQALQHGSLTHEQPFLELHLGMAARELGIHVATPVFDGASDDDVWETVAEAGMAKDAKTVLYDGRTGEPFDGRISVGVMYMIKLSHMVDDKLHAR